MGVYGKGTQLQYESVIWIAYNFGDSSKVFRVDPETGILRWSMVFYLCRRFGIRWGKYMDCSEALEHYKLYSI